MNIRTLVFAAIGSAAMLAGGAAFADSNANSPPEPYSAPDPVYTPHKVQSDVTMHEQKNTADLTDSGGSASSSNSK